MAIYAKSARYYDLLCAHKDYAAAAEALADMVRGLNPQARSLLDVACGTGGHLAFLRDEFSVEGLDLSEDMLAIARDKCPGVRFRQGNLMDFSMGRKFDVITCLFGSLGYCPDVASLRRAIRNMADHLEPDGVLVAEPWITRDRFVAGKITCDTVETPELKLARMYVACRIDDRSVLDVHFMAATPEGVETFVEHHQLTLFSPDDYTEAIAAAGLVLRPDEHELFGYGHFVAVRA